MNLYLYLLLVYYCYSLFLCLIVNLNYLNIKIIKILSMKILFFQN